MYSSCPCEGVRCRAHGALQHRDQVLVVGTEGRLASEEIAQQPDDLLVLRVCQPGVVEQLEERREGRVGVGKGEKKHAREEEVFLR